MDRKVLGRGLDALIPKQEELKRQEAVKTLRVDQVRPSKLQPRTFFDPTKIEELAQSIKEKGIIQPILVRPIGNDQYELIAGERRFRAAKHLGLQELPAIIRVVPDGDLLELSIIENIQREELNVVEEARAYRRLCQEFGMTQDAIASRLGRDKSTISNLLRILNLPEKIQDYLAQSVISFGHARALLAFGDQKNQLAFCERIIKKGLSVRQVEQLTTKKPHSHKTSHAQGSNAHVRSLEEQLQYRLGTKVKIQHGKKRGKISIEYYSLDDLDRVLRLLGVSS